MDDAQAIGSGLGEGDIRMRSHQDLPHRLASLLGIRLIRFELGDGADDAVRFEPVLDLVDEHDGAFGDGRLLNRQRSEPTSAESSQAERNPAVMQGDGARR